MHEITQNYIDIALSKLKICKQYGTNYFGNPLPKGCIYGKVTNNLYIYINEFSQFNPAYKMTRFIIYVLDKRKDVHFKQIIVSKHTEWYNMFFAYIDYHNLFDAKVEPLLCRMGKKPERKQPQSYAGYDYNVPYRHRRILEWENTYCTETDAIYQPAMYVDKQRVDKIKEKQKKINNIAEKHRRLYK